MSYNRKSTIFPCFRYYLDTTSNSLNAGYGTANGVKFDGHDYIGAGSFSTTTYAYTVPVTGLYYFKVYLNYTNDGGATDDSIDFGFNINSGERYISLIIDPAIKVNSSSYFSYNYSTTTVMQKGDTIKVFGYGVTDDQVYQLSIGYTFFEGHLISEFSD